LKNRFRARQVILFGSLAGQGVWHSQSDIDLAVEGVDPADFFKAYVACSNLLPDGLELDLVPLESASPELQARILREVEMPDDPMLALKSMVEDELVALDRVAQEMAETLAACAQPPNRIELRAIATMLHEFYNGA
ncbi:MAG: nucleotidyltransferase domain-containing protein, partial [Anaerolineae bacterium]|nr:nucleotidyltransferase domain-containing protein [Anaerolineae bacterium]